MPGPIAWRGALRGRGLGGALSCVPLPPTSAEAGGGGGLGCISAKAGGPTAAFSEQKVFWHRHRLSIPKVPSAILCSRQPIWVYVIVQLPTNALPLFRSRFLNGMWSEGKMTVFPAFF